MRRRKRCPPYAVAVLAAVVGSLAAAGKQPQQTPPAGSYVPKQSDRPEPVAGDEPGFTSIFDGKTLSGWEGNPTYWRAEQGALVGEITATTVIKSNTFIIWRGGRPKDFELKLEYRITPEGNSGINYRSAVVPDPVTPDNAFAMRGYQFDLDGRKRYPGNNYEEKGRLFLAVRGQMTRVVGGRPPVLVSAIGDEQELATLATDDWNAVHIIARGNVLAHAINSHVMTIVIDDDVPNRGTTPRSASPSVSTARSAPRAARYRRATPFSASSSPRRRSRCRQPTHEGTCLPRISRGQMGVVCRAELLSGFAL